MASRPHGNAYGQRARMASAATHQQATATGQPGSRSSSRWPMVSSAKMTASAMASAAHAYQATLTSQDSNGTKNATPKASPTANEPRRLRRYSTRASTAGPATASGQKPTGGNAPASARPPAAAAGSAQRSGRAAGGPAGRRWLAAAGPGWPAVAVRALPSGMSCIRPRVAGYAGDVPRPGSTGPGSA